MYIYILYYQIIACLNLCAFIYIYKYIYTQQSQKKFQVFTCKEFPAVPLRLNKTISRTS